MFSIAMHCDNSAVVYWKRWKLSSGSDELQHPSSELCLTKPFFQRSGRSGLAPASPTLHPRRNLAGWTSQDPQFRWHRHRSWKVGHRWRRSQTTCKDCWLHTAGNVVSFGKWLMHWPHCQPSSEIGVKETGDRNAVRHGDNIPVFCCGSKQITSCLEKHNRLSRSLERKKKITAGHVQQVFLLLSSPAALMILNVPVKFPNDSSPCQASIRSPCPKPEEAPSTACPM